MTELGSSRVLYLIVCAAPRARRVSELISRAQGRGWSVWVIPTPEALKFVDRPDLEQQTGFPVRSAYEQPGTTDDPLPPPDAMLVCPATFNTINKLAYDLADTLALALLTEAIGLNLPLVAAPVLNNAQAAHPAFERSVAALREMGVTVLYGPGVYEPDYRGLVGDPMIGSYRLTLWMREPRSTNGVREARAISSSAQGLNGHRMVLCSQRESGQSTSKSS